MSENTLQRIEDVKDKVDSLLEANSHTRGFIQKTMDDIRSDVNRAERYIGKLQGDLSEAHAIIERQDDAMFDLIMAACDDCTNKALHTDGYTDGDIKAFVQRIKDTVDKCTQNALGKE